MTERGYSAVHDNEIYTEAEAAALDLEYTAPGKPVSLLPGASTVALCDHTFELQSMRNTIEALRAEVGRLASMLAALGYWPKSPVIWNPPPADYTPYTITVTCGPLPGERE